MQKQNAKTASLAAYLGATLSAAYACGDLVATECARTLGSEELAAAAAPKAPASKKEKKEEKSKERTSKKPLKARGSAQWVMAGTCAQEQLRGLNRRQKRRKLMKIEDEVRHAACAPATD